MKNVAIIGAGLQAKRRSPYIVENPDYKITWIIDRNIEKAKNLAKQYNSQFADDYRKAINDKTVDIVVVLTFNDSHAEISIEAMKKGKNVLCEKPLSRTIEEAEQMIATAKKTKRILKCGFNHRHHPAILEAYKQFQNGSIGNPVFARGRYGIAGRKGLEKEWRSDPSIVSGGQLMEQGIHLVDLFRWFLGEIIEVNGMTSKNYWPIAPLEDNTFALLKTKTGVAISIHSSLTQWINLFEFEIYGTSGSISVQGLGGAYGTEKLVVNRYDANGPFSYNTTEYRGPDTSWKLEWNEFINAISKRTSPMGNGVDGLKAMQIVFAVYKSIQTKTNIVL